MQRTDLISAGAVFEFFRKEYVKRGYVRKRCYQKG